MVERLIGLVVSEFRTHGGGKVDMNDPLSLLRREKPPMFSAGVDVRAVVERLSDFIVTMHALARPIDTWHEDFGDGAVVEVPGRRAALRGHAARHRHADRGRGARRLG
jgi:hypothetical protein